MKQQSFFKTGILFLPTCLFIFLVSCNPESPEQTNSSETSKKPAVSTAPPFNADSAYLYAKTQVDFGPRAMNTKSHELCAQYLSRKLRSLADTLIVQETQLKQWDGKMIRMQNIIASFSPAKKKRILLCTHWDARNWADQDSVRKDEPVDAANDGAAGVGLLIEMARLFRDKKPDVGVDIFLIDAEDQGQPNGPEDTWCLGSQYWSAHPHVTGYSASFGILLDMVGAKDAVFTREAVSDQYASNIVTKVWDTGTRLGFSEYFSYEKTNSIVDDHYYINTMANIPCIDIIQYDSSTPSHFYRNWHTHQDKMEFIDRGTLHAVGQTLLEVVYNEK